MSPQVYKRRMDEIIDSIEQGFFRDAVRRFNNLVQSSNVRHETVESQLKTALFHRHGPKVDKIWTSFTMQQRKAA